MVFDWVREEFLFIFKFGVEENERAERLLGLADNPQCPDAWWVRPRGRGRWKDEEGVVGRS